MLLFIFIVINLLVALYGVYTVKSMQKQGAKRFDKLSFVSHWLIVMSLLNFCCLYLAMQEKYFLPKIIFGASLIASCFFWVVNYSRYSSLKKVIYKNQK